MLFENGQSILFTGDSITDAGRKRPVGQGLWEGVGNGYVRTFDTLLNVLYPEYIFRILNTGCSGNTSKDLLARFDTDVIALKPDWVVLMIGANDVWRIFDEPGLPENQVHLSDYEKNLTEMVIRMKAAGIRPILLTPYFMEPNRGDPMRRLMDEYGQAVRRVAEAHGVHFIDVQPVFDEYLRYRHSSYISWDRVHPSHIGSMLLAKTLLSYVGVDRPLF